MAENSQNSKKSSFVREFERVPPCYREVEKVLNQVKACKGSFKTVMNNSRLRGALFKKVYSLVANVLKYRHLLEKVIEETELLIKEPFLRTEFAGILIYELIFGKGLPGESKPVLAIRKHEKEIREAYDIAKKDVNLSLPDLHSLPRYARVNTMATSVSAVLEDLRNNGMQQVQYDRSTSLDGYMNLVRNLQVGYYLIDFHFKDLLVFASKENLPSWHLHKNGHIFIQDKSSYIPVHALNPKPGDTVLDACAAPGMKTLHIAAAMKNEGKIYAYERDKQRFETLKTTLDFGNVEICEADCEDFYLVNTGDPKFRSLEYILVDPSCSGSGMVSRMDSVTDTADSKNKERLKKLAGFQILLLKHALLFPYVKRVVYSTCSITEEENEYVVHEVLNKYGNRFKLVPVMPDWPIRGSDNFEYGHLCLRAYPDVSLTNGFFVAMFERVEFEQYEKYPLYGNSDANTHGSKKFKNKKNCNDVDFEVSNLRENEYESFSGGKIFDENYHEGDINQTFDETVTENDSKENAVRKKHKKKNISVEDQETVMNNGSDNVVESNVENISVKKKRHHEENQETMLEDNNNVTENFAETKIENFSEENVMQKKHKNKKYLSKDQDIVLEESLDNVPENTVELKVENELECSSKKKRKRKRRYSEDKNKINEEQVKEREKLEHEKEAHREHVAESKSIANEAIDCVLTKKHKRKRHNDSIKTNDCDSVVDSNKANVNTEKCSEIPYESDLQIDETQLKKKHKKKCKNKKNREENVV